MTDKRGQASKSDAEIVDELAGRVNLLGLKRRDPESFHAEKSDIASRLRQLARRLESDPRRQIEDTRVWRPAK